jgi:hypothetical protein
MPDKNRDTSTGRRAVCSPFDTTRPAIDDLPNVCFPDFAYDLARTLQRLKTRNEEMMRCTSVDEHLKEEKKREGFESQHKKGEPSLEFQTTSCLTESQIS